MSAESRKKISEKNTGKKRSDEARRQMIVTRSGSGNINYGRTTSEETKQKIGTAHKGRIIGEAWRKKMSDSHKLVPKLECPYCLRYLDPGNYKKHHGDKCKLKTTTVTENIINE